MRRHYSEKLDIEYAQKRQCEHPPLDNLPGVCALCTAWQTLRLADIDFVYRDRISGRLKFYAKVF